MTRKETLLKEVYELRNELSSIRGEETREYDEAQLRREAKNEREYDLRCRIDELKSGIARAAEQKAIKERREAFYATPEGKSYKEKHTEILTELYMENERYETNALKIFKGFAERIGEGWSVRNLGDGYVDFAIVADNNFVFGSSIEVRYSSRWFGEQPRFEVNVGTTGCFDPQAKELKDRATFYRGFGRFLSDERLLEEVRRAMAEYEATKEQYRLNVKAEKDAIDNPKMEA